MSNCKKIDLYTKAPVTRRVPLLSRAYQSGFYLMLPRFGGHPNTTEGGGHNAENTRAYAPEATSYVVIVPMLMIVIPPIQRFVMGRPDCRRAKASRQFVC